MLDDFLVIWRHVLSLYMYVYISHAYYTWIKKVSLSYEVLLYIDQTYEYLLEVCWHLIDLCKFILLIILKVPMLWLTALVFLHSVFTFSRA